MKPAESGEKKATRQCWECLKRRLVCDHTLPHCKKCIKAGKDCPGYDEQKPLQWVEPGKVTSRRRKKNGASKVYTIRPRDSEPLAPTIPILLVADSQESDPSDLAESITRKDSPTLEYPIVLEPQLSPEAVELYKNQLASMLIQEENATWWNGLTTEEQTEHITIMAAETSTNIALANRFWQMGGQKNLKKALKLGQGWEAKVLFPSDRDPLTKLRRILWIMEMNQLPSYDNLSNETSEVVQSVNYCKYVPHY